MELAELVNRTIARLRERGVHVERPGLLGVVVQDRRAAARVKHRRSCAGFYTTVSMISMSLRISALTSAE